MKTKPQHDRSSYRFEPHTSTLPTFIEVGTKIVGALVVLTIFVCIAVSAADGWSTFLTFLAGPAASWAQAIFGALAIAGAIGLGWWQDEQRRRTQNAQEAKLIRMMADLAHSALYAVGYVDARRSREGGIENQDSRDYSRAEFKNLLAVLDSIPLVSLPNAYVMQQVFVVKKQLQEALTLIRPVEPQYGAKEIHCSEQFGRPWRPIVSRIREAEEYLRMELDGVRPYDDDF